MRWIYAHPMLGLLLPWVVAIVVLVSTGIRPEWGPRDKSESYYEWYAARAWRQRTDHTVRSSEYWRQQLLARYRSSGIAEEELGTIEALTLGYRDDLKKDIKKHFSRSGAMHVLAVSGMHVGVLYGFLLMLLTVFGRFRPLYEERRWQCVLSGSVILLLVAYAWITGLSASVVRSVLMCVLVEVSKMTRRNSELMKTLFAAAFLILCCRPSDLYSIGFQLSFAAVAAIVLIVKPVNYVVDLVTVSVAAQLGTMPLSMYYFGQMSNYFLLTNILALPLAGLLMILAVLFFTIGWIPAVGAVLAQGMEWTTRGLHRWTAMVDSLPGSVTEIDVSMPMMLLLYGAIVTGLLAMRKNLWWLTGTTACMIGFCVLYIR